jgi:hypothetical protein
LLKRPRPGEQEMSAVSAAIAGSGASVAEAPAKPVADRPAGSRFLMPE